MLSILCVAVLLVASVAEAKPPRTDITVSGISSGGAMAAQLHLAYSSVVSASGIVAGPPYWCAQDTLIYALSECLEGPALLIPVSKLIGQLQSYVQAGSADSTSNLKNDPVYIFSGTSDHTVVQDVVKVNEQIFSSFGAHIQTNYDSPANHAFVTNQFGGPCELLNFENFINNCSFDLAYAILNHAFGGNLTKPSASKPTPLHGQFVTIEQPALVLPEAVNTADLETADIFSYWADLLKSSTENNKPLSKLPGSVLDASSLNASGFDKEGYLYYPSGCSKGKKCPIHIALHGCLQGKARIGDVFAKNTGYLEVAELNHIIILFPQIVATYIDPVNAEGCWDWWGYGGTNYANKLGVQMAGVIKMAQSIKAINAAGAQ